MTHRVLAALALAACAERFSRDGCAVVIADLNDARPPADARLSFDGFEGGDRLTDESGFDRACSDSTSVPRRRCREARTEAVWSSQTTASAVTIWSA